MRRRAESLRELWKTFRKVDISSYASGTAFFCFLSLVPMLLMLCTIIPYTSLTRDHLIGAAQTLFPEGVSGILAELIQEIYEKSAGILSAAALTTLWSAGKGMQALTRGLNAVNRVEEERGFVLLRLVSSLYTFLLTVILLVSLFLIVFGDRLMKVAFMAAPRLGTFLKYLYGLRFLAGWLILMLIFVLLYTFLPAKKQAFGKQFPGAAFAAVGWNLFSWCFSIYVSGKGSYGMYGSLSLIVLLMIWLYVCMYLVILGAWLNRFLSERESF